MTARTLPPQVVASDGHTYERKALLRWCRATSWRSPKTGLPLESRLLVPNHHAQTQARASEVREYS